MIICVNWGRGDQYILTGEDLISLCQLRKSWSVYVDWWRVDWFGSVDDWSVYVDWWRVDWFRSMDDWSVYVDWWRVDWFRSMDDWSVYVDWWRVDWFGSMEEVAHLFGYGAAWVRSMEEVAHLFGYGAAETSRLCWLMKSLSVWEESSKQRDKQFVGWIRSWSVYVTWWRTNKRVKNLVL